jgi:hypothetical protein
MVRKRADLVAQRLARRAAISAMAQFCASASPEVMKRMSGRAWGDRSAIGGGRQWRMPSIADPKLEAGLEFATELCACIEARCGKGRGTRPRRRVCPSVRRALNTRDHPHVPPTTDSNWSGPSSHSEKELPTNGGHKEMTNIVRQCLSDNVCQTMLQPPTIDAAERWPADEATASTVKTVPIMSVKRASLTVR